MRCFFTPQLLVSWFALNTREVLDASSKITISNPSDPPSLPPHDDHHFHPSNQSISKTQTPTSTPVPFLLSISPSVPSPRHSRNPAFPPNRGCSPHFSPLIPWATSHVPPSIPSLRFGDGMSNWVSKSTSEIVAVVNIPGQSGGVVVA